MTIASRILPALLLLTGIASAQAPASETALRSAIDSAVASVKPALVRIHVVEAYYREGREMKYEASGSGVIITPEGHVVTNHHVAGHAKQLKVTMSNKEEIDAELIGGDPLTDVAVIKLVNPDGRVYPTVQFGDSSKVRVGDHVLAMGSPLSISQSVTLGIVSNTEMILPGWMGRYGGLEQDGEDVGKLVRWLAHDAEIHPGNSGGALVDLSGQIVGINEIKVGLAGAIPSNIAKEVAAALIEQGDVPRSWLGVEVQPRLKYGGNDTGVLLSGTLKGAPADKAGLKAGDLILSLNGKSVDVQFPEQAPDFYLLESQLPVDQSVPVVLIRDGEEMTLDITPMRRQKREPDQYEIKPWGITVRDISFLMAKELKRENSTGVIVTSIRPGGPVGNAKPTIAPGDIIVGVNDTTIDTVADLQKISREILGDSDELVPVLTNFERKTEEYVTVVKIGMKDLEDPGLEVKKAWLPVETQVVTRDIAELMGDTELTGFRVSHVYKGSTADVAGLRVGDIIRAVDGEPMTASEPEHYEELPAFIRQYRVGTEAELDLLRDGTETKVSVELILAPKLAREMPKYRNDDFEFTVRDVTFFDKATEQWEKEERGVLVDQVKPGSWAALGQLSIGDLIKTIDGTSIAGIEDVESIMEKIAETKPESVVIKVLRGIHTLFIELEPQWDA